jgi:hypothetical protein
LLLDIEAGKNSPDLYSIETALIDLKNEHTEQGGKNIDTQLDVLHGAVDEMKTLQELSHEEKIDVLEKEVSPGWRREYLVQLIREEGEQASVALVTQDVHAGVAAGWIPQ